MNEYLNLILRNKNKDDIIINEKQLKMTDLIKHKYKKRQNKSQNQSEDRHQYQKLAGNFYRKLKKQSKGSGITYKSHYITIDEGKGSD